MKRNKNNKKIRSKPKFGVVWEESKSLDYVSAYQFLNPIDALVDPFPILSVDLIIYSKLLNALSHKMQLSASNTVFPLYLFLFKLLVLKY